jgi:phosphoglycolate phosphatase-like HAD superfamily hydrolase
VASSRILRADPRATASIIFSIKKLKVDGADAVAIGDTPYDAAAAGKAGIATIGLLCGGFTESLLREAGCDEIYPGTATLFARLRDSMLGR